MSFRIRGVAAVNRGQGSRKKNQQQMAGKQEGNRAKAMRARAGLTLAAVAALTPGVAGYIPMALKPGPLSTSCGRVLSARPSCDFGGQSLVATSWPLMRGAAISALRASSAEEQPSAEKTQRNTDEEKIVQDFKIEGTGEGGRIATQRTSSAIHHSILSTSAPPWADPPIL